MNESNLIAIETICFHYNIEESFISELDALGLLQIAANEQGYFVYQEQIGDLEKIIRLQQDLNLNLEAIDVIFNLLEKQRALREELNSLKNRLSLYE